MRPRWNLQMLSTGSGPGRSPLHLLLEKHCCECGKPRAFVGLGHHLTIGVGVL